MTFDGLWIKCNAMSVASAIKCMDLNRMFVELLENLNISLAMISKSMMEVNSGYWIL